MHSRLSSQRGEGSLLASRPRGRRSMRGRHAVRAVEPCIQRVGHAERSSLSLEHTLPARHGTVCSGTRAWRVKRSHGTHVRGALRSKFSWHAHRSPGKVEASRCPCAYVRRQCQRLCSIESWSRSRQRQSKARSAVLAASAQGQGSTEVPNVKRAAAHCHLVVVGGHVDSSGASGCRQHQSEENSDSVVSCRRDLACICASSAVIPSSVPCVSPFLC